MKKLLFFISSLVLIGAVYAFMPAHEYTSEHTEVTENELDKIEWIDWTTAVERNKTDKKAFLVDVYTHWCGWCKRMDKTTFEDPKIVKYVSENFHAIKMNAEDKKPITFNGHEFKWVAGGRNGVHTLAASLMDNRMSYPTIVYLNEKIERIMISPGFKQPDQIITELKFAAEKHYQTGSFDQYKQQAASGK